VQHVFNIDYVYFIELHYIRLCIMRGSFTPVYILIILSLYHQSYRVTFPSDNAYYFCSGGSWLISAESSTMLTEVFMCFLSPSKQMPEECVKLGHENFL
jgi:hypothetical protein